MNRWLVPLLAVSPFVACGGSKPAPATSAPAESAAPVASIAVAPVFDAIDSGKDCAKAQARCGGGICNVKVDNKCDQAVHCDLAVVATCDTQDGVVSANGRERETFAAGTSGEVSAQAACASGRVVGTEVKSLKCK